LPAASYAGTRDPGVNHRQHNQQQRIEQGWRSGELTGGEARHLGREARGIQREERRYKSDGNLSGRERADLHRDLNSLNRDIFREKHDNQRRFEHGPVTRWDAGPGRHERRFDHRPVARWDPSIDRREHHQMERIQQGMRSGALTRDEAKRLLQEQRGIRQEERQYKSDGVLTQDERIDLQQDLNAASQHIYNETHDADRRGFNTGFSR
jgi:hypothetical protein